MFVTITAKYKPVVTKKSTIELKIAVKNEILIISQRRQKKLIRQKEDFELTVIIEE